MEFLARFDASEFCRNCHPNKCSPKCSGSIFPRTDHVLCRPFSASQALTSSVFCHLLFAAGRNNSSVQHFSRVWCRILQRQLELLLCFEERVLERWLNQINPTELVTCPVSFPRAALLLGRSWDKEARDALVQVRGSKSSSSWIDGLKTFCPQSLKSKLDPTGAQLLVPT